MGVIQLEGKKIEEGELFNKWLYNRLFAANKNAIITTTGATGSGKSLLDLRIAELWYKFTGKGEFPISHCCFSIDEIIRLIKNGELKRGDLMILEEGGVNLGSLDFQNKISKIFTYVLQSFRSLNLILMINLPYSSMLNKNARMLTHCNLSTVGIDKETNTVKIKAKIHQVNEQTGKIYPKFLRAKHQGGVRKFKRLKYSLPSEGLRQEYEKKKFKFVTDLVAGFADKLEEQGKEVRMKLSRNGLTPIQKETYDLYMQGFNQYQIAEKLGKTQGAVQDTLRIVREKGYSLRKAVYSLGKQEKSMVNPSISPI